VLTDGAADLDGGPVWSPDGSQLAIRRTPDGGDGEIAVVDVASGETRIVAEGPGNQFAPTWSPDGSQIAFVSNPSGGAGGARILATTPQGSEARALFPGVPGRQSLPLWSRR
jgi:Tol biopolymer transport system component